MEGKQTANYLTNNCQLKHHPPYQTSIQKMTETVAAAAAITEQNELNGENVDSLSATHVCCEVPGKAKLWACACRDLMKPRNHVQ